MRDESFVQFRPLHSILQAIQIRLNPGAQRSPEGDQCAQHIASATIRVWDRPRNVADPGHSESCSESRLHEADSGSRLEGEPDKLCADLSGEPILRSYIVLF